MNPIEPFGILQEELPSIDNFDGAENGRDSRRNISSRSGKRSNSTMHKVPKLNILVATDDQATKMIVEQKSHKNIHFNSTRPANDFRSTNKRKAALSSHGSFIGSKCFSPTKAAMSLRPDSCFLSGDTKSQDTLSRYNAQQASDLSERMSLALFIELNRRLWGVVVPTILNGLVFVGAETVSLIAVGRLNDTYAIAGVGLS